MTARDRHSAQAAYQSFHDDQHYDQLLLPGERIGPSPRRGVFRTFLRRGIIILIVVGGGWAYLTGQVTWPAWLPADLAALLPSMDHKSPTGAATALPRAEQPLPSIIEQPEKKLAALDAPPSSTRYPTATPDSVPPAATPKSAPAPLTTGSLPLPANRGGEAPDGPLRPAVADPADPYQVRAAAAGLHPELSRALLARLSATDYRNAGIAIKNALAETSDTAIYVWPRQPKPEEALFKVRFVPGAAAGCRRYVVSVTKDGWLTTAPPMEKCGSQPRQARRQ